MLFGVKGRGLRGASGVTSPSVGYVRASLGCHKVVVFLPQVLPLLMRRGVEIRWCRVSSFVSAEPPRCLSDERMVSLVVVRAEKEQRLLGNKER